MPTRLTRQPQQPAQIDWANPLTRTLSYASAAGAGGPDIATTVGSIPKTAGRAGIADAMSAGNYKVARNPKVGTAAKGTIVVLHNSTVLPPNGPTYSHVLASTAPSGSQNCFLLMLGNGNGWLQFRVYAGSSGTQDGAADSSVALNDGKPHVTVATYDMAAGGTLATYVDNVNTSSNTHPTAITQSANLTIGHSRDTFWGDFEGNITAVLFFDSVLTRAEIAQITANPWQVFKSPQRRLLVDVPAGGAATYSYTASGGFVLSGTAPTVRGITRTATGGATFSGSAAQSRGAVKTSSGGILFAGAAALARGKAYTASGGLTLSGASTVLRGLAKTASGGLLFSGAAGVTFHSAVQSLVVNPVGGIVISGASTVARSVRFVANGGLSLAGHAATTFFPPIAGFLGGLLPEFVRRRRRR